MARKQTRRRVQRQAGAPRPAVESRPAAPRPSRGGGEQALVRSVEMSLGGQAVMRGRGRGRYVLESGDAGIPLDRVPYFTHDLRQVLVVGVAMIVLLVVASYLVVPQLVK